MSGARDRRDLLSKRVVSGLGEKIGVVVRVDASPDGTATRLWILEEPGDATAPLREVSCRFIRNVNTDDITLKGPREGFHITRVGRLGPPSPLPLAEEAAGVGSGVVPMDSYPAGEFVG